MKMKRKADDAGSGNKVEFEGVTGTFIPDELWQLTRSEVFGWPHGGEGGGDKALGLFQDPADARALAREQVERRLEALVLTDNATFTYEQYLAGVKGAWENICHQYDYDTSGAENSRYHGESTLNDGTYLIWCDDDPDETCGETVRTEFKIQKYEVPEMKFTSRKKK